MNKTISDNKIIELALRYRVSVNSELESFFCDLLEISPDSLQEEMNQYMMNVASKSFISDAEKMADFMELDRDEFMFSYSYLTDEEYDATLNYLSWLKGKENKHEIR